MLLKGLLMMMGVVMLAFVTSCDDECPADEGTVTVKVVNVKKKNDNSYLYMTIRPCYDKSVLLYSEELTKEGNYTKSVALNTGDYRVSVSRNTSSYSIGETSVQVRRGRNVEIVADEETNTFLSVKE